MSDPANSLNRPKLVQGNEACALGALAAGLQFYAGYPITPSTEIAEICAKQLPLAGGSFLQMEDEIASLAACIGASLAGKKAMTATSGPGFSLMQECLGYASFTEIPLVIVDVQRYGPSTGMPTSLGQGDVMQSRWGSHGDYPVIVLAPGNVGECFELTFKAFDLTERYRIPVIMLMDETLAHMRQSVILPEAASLSPRSRLKPDSRSDYKPYAADPDGGVPPMASFGDGYRWHVTGLVHDEAGRPSSDGKVADRLARRLAAKLEKAAPKIEDYEGLFLEDADIVLISFGASALSCQAAVTRARNDNIKAGLLRLKSIWPFPEAALRKATQTARRLVVVEMNLGQLALEVERVLGQGRPILRLGKADGELFHPDYLYSVIARAQP